MGKSLLKGFRCSSRRSKSYRTRWSLRAADAVWEDRPESGPLEVLWKSAQYRLLQKHQNNHMWLDMHGLILIYSLTLIHVYLLYFCDPVCFSDATLSNYTNQLAGSKHSKKGKDNAMHTVSYIMQFISFMAEDTTKPAADSQWKQIYSCLDLSFLEGNSRSLPWIAPVSTTSWMWRDLWSSCLRNNPGMSVLPGNGWMLSWGSSPCLPRGWLTAKNQMKKAQKTSLCGLGQRLVTELLVICNYPHSLPRPIMARSWLTSSSSWSSFSKNSSRISCFPEYIFKNPYDSDNTRKCIEGIPGHVAVLCQNVCEPLHGEVQGGRGRWL